MIAKEKQERLFEDIYISTKKYDLLELDQYDKIIVSISGGKDSLALLLYLLDQGIDKNKLELWHQHVDDPYFDSPLEMDWPSTEGYLKKLSQHFGIELHWQWRGQGFYGEIMKTNSLSQDIFYRNDEETLVYCLPTLKGSVATRRKFPAKSADLRIRYCSSQLKIGPARRVLNNRNDLKGSENEPMKILWLTGERRQESPARSKYAETEHHPSSTRLRTVHYWRAVIDWKEEDVWSIIEKHRIVPHPAYFIGFPRLSCRSCIFYSPDLWKTLSEVDPESVRRLIELEQELNFTIDQKYTLQEMIRIGNSRITDENKKYIKTAVEDWTTPVTTDKWLLPQGAFGGNEGGSI